MSKKRKKSPPQADKNDKPVPIDPVNVADGIPDRSENCRAWQYLVLGAVFAAWIAFMTYCQIAAADH